MDKYLYSEQKELWYELQGDYYLPCLKLPEEEAVRIGIWGQRHRRYLKTHRRALYTSLLTGGKLKGCGNIERQTVAYYKTLDELYTAEQVDNVILARAWDNITEFDCVDFELSGYWE